MDIGTWDVQSVALFEYGMLTGNWVVPTVHMSFEEIREWHGQILDLCIIDELKPQEEATMAGNHRITAGSKRARQISSTKAPSRSAHGAPAVSGEKEAARGKRFYMCATFPNGSPRSAPVLQIYSKGSYDIYVEATQQEYEG